MKLRYFSLARSNRRKSKFAIACRLSGNYAGCCTNIRVAVEAITSLGAGFMLALVAWQTIQ